MELHAIPNPNAKRIYNDCTYKVKDTNSIKIIDNFQQSEVFNKEEMYILERLKEMLFPHFIQHFKNEFVEFQKNQLKNKSTMYQYNCFQIGIIPNKNHMLECVFAAPFQKVWDVLKESFIEETNKIMLEKYGYAFMFSDLKDGLLTAVCFKFNIPNIRSYGFFDLLRFEKYEIQKVGYIKNTSCKELKKAFILESIKEGNELLYIFDDSGFNIKYENTLKVEDIYYKEKGETYKKTNEYECLIKSPGNLNPGKYYSVKKLTSYLSYQFCSNEGLVLAIKQEKSKEIANKQRKQFKEYLKKLGENSMKGHQVWLC